jgi:hypothetical protein
VLWVQHTCQAWGKSVPTLALQQQVPQVEKHKPRMPADSVLASFPQAKGVAGYFGGG